MLMLYKLAKFLFSIKLREKTYNFRIKSGMCKRSIGTNLLVQTSMRSCKKKSKCCHIPAKTWPPCAILGWKSSPLKIHVQSKYFAI